MIDKTMTIQEILKANPHSVRIFKGFGLSCATCELGALETLEEGAKGHGLTTEELERLLKALNS